MKTRIEVPSLKSQVPSRITCSRGKARWRGVLRLSMAVRLALALAFSVSLTGCFGFLKPAKPTARHFVLERASVRRASRHASRRGGCGGRAGQDGALSLQHFIAVEKARTRLTICPRPSGPSAWTLACSGCWRRTWRPCCPRTRSGSPPGRTRTFRRRSMSMLNSLTWTPVARQLSRSGGVSFPRAERRRSKPASAGSRARVPRRTPTRRVATLSELAAELSRQAAQAIKETAPASARMPLTGQCSRVIEAAAGGMPACHT